MNAATIGLLAALLLAAAMSLTLTGCMFRSSVEDLFTLPRVAAEYEGLSQELDDLQKQGYELVGPSTGQNIQPVQMVDLDNDGLSEALVFMRLQDDEKPLKIFVFRLEDGTYTRFCTIESSGSAIDSVYYQDLNGDGRRELIVGWRISAEVQTVAVYTVEREPVVLMSSGYNRFTLQDLNGDGIPSLLVLRTDGNSQSVAEFYGWQDEQMGVAYRCVLSSSMVSLNRGSMVSGRVDADTPALFITGVDEQGMAATDILVFRQDLGLVNLALSGSSTGSGSGDSSGSGGNAEGIFQGMNQLSQLNDGEALNFFDQSSDFFRHGKYPPNSND